MLVTIQSASLAKPRKKEQSVLNAEKLITPFQLRRLHANVVMRLDEREIMKFALIYETRTWTRALSIIGKIIQRPHGRTINSYWKQIFQSVIATVNLAC